MGAGHGFFTELKRRNIWRAAVLYIGTVWALSQGVAQLGPVFGLPNWGTRWFVIACIIGFPFWIAFSWLYELTPQGIKRESEAPTDAPAQRATRRRLDIAIIGVLAVAVALLASGYFVRSNSPFASTAGIPPKSIAVLPFDNLSKDEQNEYFVAGMQDLILTKLAALGNLKVISRTSTMKYKSRPENLKKVANELGVANILEGSVQKVGNEVLINVQLIDAFTDTHLWAETYLRTLEDIFGVEGEVAGKIASALHAELSSAESAELAAVPTTDKAAYDLFLRAEYQASKGNVNYDTGKWQAAIPLYLEAILRDPGFALALARLSYVQSILAWFHSGELDVEELNANARSNAARALQLAPTLAAAHIASGYSDYYGRADYASALQAFDKALALRPNDSDALVARGYIERRQGRFDDAIKSFTRALSFDPRNSRLAFEAGITHMMIGDFDKAEHWLKRALAIDPGNRNAQYRYSLAVLLRSGDVARALKIAEGDAPALKSSRSRLLVYQRRYDEAIKLLQSIADTPNVFSAIRFGSKPLRLANLYRLKGDLAKARELYAQALTIASAKLDGGGNGISALWSRLADAQLGLGKNTDALDSIAKSMAIVDAIEDHFSTPILTRINAGLYARAGRPDLAVPLLARALASPGIGYIYSPVLLWLDPEWDSIRDDPGFQALLKQYAESRNQ